MAEIAEVLGRAKHTRSQKNIKESLRQMMEAGWIEPDEQGVKRYGLTIAGVNVLNELEKAIRKQRVERI